MNEGAGMSDASGSRARWCLDEDIVFLNHGSFGACPRSVLDEQARLREQMERNPVNFFHREARELLDAARAALGDFLSAPADDLAYVPNVTTGINAVLRSLLFSRGDELLVTDHEYNASRNVLEFVAGEHGCSVVVVEIPFPIDSPETVLDRIMSRVTDRTRLALLDHVTSPTGLIVPLAELIRELHARNVDVLVDGAHAPGMLPVDLSELGPDYYGGNCHKWLCAPKGAGFLYVTPELQYGVRPAVISHGANAPVEEEDRFRAEFDWTGTRDITPWLSVPHALRCMSEMLPGGWPEVMKRNNQLALEGRRIVADALEVPLPCPDSMVASLATLILPESTDLPADAPRAGLDVDPLQQALWERHRIEVPILSLPGSRRRMIRMSAQLYNERSDFERLAQALRELCRG